MSLKIQCPLTWHVTKMECHLKVKVTQNGMSLKMECYSKWNIPKKKVTLNGTGIITQNKMSFKRECHLK